MRHFLYALACAWWVLLPCSTPRAWAQTAPSLGAARGFAVLSGTTVTNAGATTITGDLGVSPGTAVTGFPPGIILLGAIHAGDPVAVAAQASVATAYDNLAAQTCNQILSGIDLGGLTLTPDVYCFGAAATLSGTLTLDAQGDPNAVFIFQMGTTLTTGANSAVVMINDGSEGNVFWQVGTSATLGANSTLAGNVLVFTSTTLTGGASVRGRVLARGGAVTLDTNTVTAPIADLATTKTALGASVTPGETFSYRIDVANNGPSAASNVVATDSLPSQLTFVSSPSGCTAVGQVVTCGPGSIAPSSLKAFTIVVRLDPAYTGNGSDIANVATASSELADPIPGNNSSPPAPPPIVSAPSANLSLSKTAIETGVTAGQTFTYRLVAANAGPSTASAVVVTDSLPAPLAFVSSPQGCTAVGQAVSCPTVASLPPAGAATFDLVVRLDPSYVGSGADIANVAGVTAATADPAVSNNANAPAAPPPVGPPSADLTLTKAAIEATVTPGGTYTYRVVVTNIGPSTATTVTVADALPAPLAFVSSPSGCTVAASTVSCGIAAILPGNAAQFDFVVRLSPAYTGNGSDLANVATASSAVSDPDPSNNSSAPAPAPAVAAASADLSLTKAAVESTVAPGQTFAYQIVVTNSGPSASTSIVIDDTLPAALAFVSSPQGCTAAGQLVSCPAVASLSVGATTTVTLVVRLDAAYSGNGSDLGNVAVASAATSDPNPGNNANPAAPPPTVGPAQSDLQLVKGVSAAPVTPGSNFSYTVQVTNNGPSLATGVVISDPLPAQTTFVASAAGCTAIGQNVTCPTLPALAVGTSVAVDIVVQLNPAYSGDGTDIVNSATVTAATSDPVPQNNANPPGAPPPVGPPGADVTVVKTVSAAPVAPGETFSYALLVSNQGPSAATNVVTTDLLPAGLTFVSSVDGCGAAGQSVTCPTIASLSPGGATTLRFVVLLDPSFTGNASDLPNRGTVSAATADPVPANNTSPAVMPNLGPGSADLSIAKVASGSPVSPGMLFTYRIGVVNAGPSTAVDVAVSDRLPAPLTFVSSLTACTALGQVVTCARPNMLAGTTASFDITVRLDSAYAGNGSDIVNTATVAASTPDPISGNNQTSPTPPPPLGTGEADLTVTKSAAPVSNGEVAYTIVVTNQGPSPAADVVVQDPTPAGLSFLLNTGDCTTAFPCSLGAMLPGQARTITARYTVPPGATGVVTNTATVSSSTPDPTLTNNTAVATSSSDPLTYYLAEGATGTFWKEDVSIANPNPAPATVTMAFFKEDGETITRTLTVGGMSHVTVRVGDLPGLENTTTSATITSESGLPLAVERTMTWDASMHGGHTETAAPQLATRWYFAEGAQGYFETFLLLGNPTPSAVDVTVTFLLESAGPVVRTWSIGAHARLTVQAGAIPELVSGGFGILVVATQPIVAERSMYFGTTATRAWSGGHASGGVTEPSPRWFYAEGATGSFFDTFILLSNPQPTDAHVTLEYILPDGSIIAAAKVVPAQRRLTVNVEGEGDARLHATSVSTRITADLPIVTERSMYWGSKPDASPWSEGHNSFGVDQAAPRWGLAGARVGGPNNFHSYILLSNPWAAAAEVTVAYMRDGGPPIVKTYVVPPTTRFTIDVNNAVPELQHESFGAAIAVTNGLTISVERSLYWDGDGVFWTAGTNAAGTKLP